jgi:uncharacterized phiE125 gp8 family phage protein
MALSLVDEPATLPLALDDAKDQARIDVDDEDELIQGLIGAVTERAELATNRALITQTWDYVLDGFPSGTVIEIPKPPLQSVTFIKYVDTSGVLQMWSSAHYLVQAPAGPRAARGRIALPFAGVWPITLGQMGSVTIRFVCGYGDKAADVPGLLLAGMRLDFGTLYENREGVVLGGRGSAPDELPMGVRDIYRAYKSWPTQRVAA